MSEEFDREAEREKLREQFERDDRKRESTERMSELLLKGATMTNKHCDRCGSPAFRYQGQEFCPTCQAGDASQQATADAADGGAQRADAAETRAQSDDAAARTDAADAESSTPPADGSAPATDRGTATRDRATADHAGETAPEATDGRAREESGARTPDVTDGRAPDAAPSAAAPTGANGDLAAARESLTRTVTRLAAAAERADDVGRAREYLAAAREAAEALSAVEDADR